MLEELDFEDKGESYRGTQSKTIGGLVCQSWDSEFPHEHGHTCHGEHEEGGEWYNG